MCEAYKHSAFERTPTPDVRAKSRFCYSVLIPKTAILQIWYFGEIPKCTRFLRFFDQGVEMLVIAIADASENVAGENSKFSCFKEHGGNSTTIVPFHDFLASEDALSHIFHLFISCDDKNDIKSK